MSYRPQQPDDPILFTVASMEMSVWRGWTGSLSFLAWPLANLGLFVPFSVPIACVAREGWVGSATTGTGNFDIGIYNTAGTRLTSSGATAKTASSVIVNTTTMTDYTLLPNVIYYMAMSSPSSTDTYQAIATAAGIQEAMGVLEATSAYVLPSSVTYAKTTRAYLSYFGLNFQSAAL